MIKPTFLHLLLLMPLLWHPPDTNIDVIYLESKICVLGGTFGILDPLFRLYILVLTSSTTGSQQTKRGRKASLFYLISALLISQWINLLQILAKQADILSTMDEPPVLFSIALGVLLICLLSIEWLRAFFNKKHLELHKTFDSGTDEFNSFIREKSDYVIKANFNGIEPDDPKELIAYHALQSRRLLAFWSISSTGLGKEVIIVLFVMLGLCSIGLIVSGIFSNFIRYGISGIFGLLFIAVGWRILHIFKTLHDLTQEDLDIYRQALDR